MRDVEIRVRDLANAPASLVGVALVQMAFRQGGSLADPAAHPAEQDATMALFWGAIGVFKNPSSHREVHFESREFARDLVLLADLLHRLLDGVEERLTP